jgi:hypothetical protein
MQMGKELMVGLVTAELLECYLGSHYKIRSRTVSILVAEYLVGGFMR